MLYQEKNSVGQGFYECIRYQDFSWYPHMHRHPELIYVREGAVEAEIDGRRERIPAGSCALVLSNQVHTFESPGGSLADVCIFSEDLVPAMSREFQGKVADSAVFQCRPSVRIYAESELFCPDHIPDYYILKSVLYGVLWEYRRQIHFEEKIKKGDLFNQIIHYVNQNYAEDISLKSMAEALGYEQHYLSRCFHSRISMHFSSYVNWYRVDAASELLRNTDLPVTQIAMQSGFQSIRSFNRVFRDFTGKSPSELKENG